MNRQYRILRSFSQTKNQSYNIMKHPFLLCLATFALAVPAAHAATIFSHTFDEGTGGLNGTAVDTGTGSWVAAGVVTANGVFSTGQGSATLAFAPTNGFEYHLDARISNVTGGGTGSGSASPTAKALPAAPTSASSPTTSSAPHGRCFVVLTPPTPTQRSSESVR